MIVHTPSDYQELAARTMNKDLTHKERVSMLAMGLSGEAGEVTDYLKKVIFHEHSMDLEKFSKEMGDFLWYAANLASEYDLRLVDIMQQNINKLRKRYPEGFSTKDSLARKDIEEDEDDFYTTEM